MKKAHNLKWLYLCRPHSSFGNRYTHVITCTDLRLKRGNRTEFCYQLVLFALQTCLEVISWEKNNCQRRMFVLFYRLTPFKLSLLLVHHGYDLDALMFVCLFVFFGINSKRLPEAITSNQRYVSFLGNYDNVLHRLKTDIIDIESQHCLYVS